LKDVASLVDLNLATTKITDEGSSANEPPKRLVAWEKVLLSPGEAKMVTLKLDPTFVGGATDSTPLSAPVRR
jgi:hypothetical protein